MKISGLYQLFYRNRYPPPPDYYDNFKGNQMNNDVPQCTDEILKTLQESFNKVFIWKRITGRKVIRRQRKKIPHSVLKDRV